MPLKFVNDYWLPGLDWLAFGQSRSDRALRVPSPLLPSLRRTMVRIQARQPNCGAIWLPGLDSNQNWMSQSHLCCHYTTGQWIRGNEYAETYLIAVKAGNLIGEIPLEHLSLCTTLPAV